ncbi:P-loop containing nucleoside triphosphate hydrolase protein [Stachybotrys elegans]|uniref:P-loop containing nucleoside triphosphate hydrolase protein n=1 Tax=Stachybotrys elegans TaxID=80388 RepID=A0A8K0SQG0_9HYPO|nr:P-loop containing nucleoside triphosphate hydrolase protein [Stachybotrys elegans]
MNHHTISGSVSGCNLSNVAVSGGTVTINTESRAAGIRKYIPYPRNETIVLRPSLTEQLDVLLPKTSEAQMAALFGLGGSGKTHLALDFAYRRLSESFDVFWVHAESYATFSQDYRRIADVLDVDTEGLSEAEILHAVRIAIEKRSRWLLVIDNADHLALFDPPQTIQGASDQQQPNAQARQTGAGTVLWTSREESIVGRRVSNGRGIKVTHMALEEAKQLLWSVINDGTMGSEDDDQLELVVEELGHLPLAVSQAGAYMRLTMTKIPEYLEILGEGQKRWNVLNETYHDRYRPNNVSNSILQTWRISFDRLKADDELAFNMLHIATHLEYQDVQWSVLREVAKVATELNEGKGKGKKEEPDNVTIRRAVRRLIDFAFVSHRKDRPGEESYEMHKLVREGIQFQLSLAQAGDANTEMPWTTHRNTRSRRSRVKRDRPRSEYPRSAVAALVAMDKLFPRYKIGEHKKWPVYEVYFPHCMRVAELPDFPGENARAGHFFRRAGHYALDRGLYAQSVTLWAKAWEVLRKEFGQEHEVALAVQIDLGNAHLWNGDVDEANKHLVAALNSCQEHLGDEHRLTLDAMRLVGDSRRKQQRYDEAKDLLERACEIDKRMRGEEHHDTILSGYSLAEVYYEQGDYKRAQEIFSKVLAQWRQLYGEEHRDTIAAKWSLAYTYRRLPGRQAEAIRLMEEAIRGFRNTIGPLHPMTRHAEEYLEQWTSKHEMEEMET